MERWNQRVERRMEELGLDKRDMESVRIASESLEAEDYESSFGTNQVSEGLWLGGMDRGRKRDHSSSFGPNSHNLGKEKEKEVIWIDSDDSDDDKDVGGSSSWQDTRLNLHLGLGSDEMETGETSYWPNTQGNLRLGLGSDNVEIGETSYMQNTQVDLRLGLGTDDMDIGETSPRQNTQGNLRLGLGSDNMEMGETSYMQNTQVNLRLGLGTVDMEIGEENRLELLAEVAEDVELHQVNPLPQIPEAVILFRQLVDQYERQQLREAAQRFARVEHPDENSGTQRPVVEAEQFGSSGGFFWESLKEVRARTSKIVAEKLIKWTPSIQDHSVASSSVPSLVELSLQVLAENANYIASLNLVPYFLRKKLIDQLCDSCRMNADIFNLLLQGSPTELRVKNCSWLTDDQFHQSLQSWLTENLRVLQLDLGGQIMFDYALRDKLTQSPNSFSKLAVLSLRGAGRLTDLGVALLVKSASTLVSVNLGLCSLLTCEAVKSIADYLGKNLRELYIDGCENIKATQIASHIAKLKELEVFSVAGLEDVSDGFILQLVTACGDSLKDLDVADCPELTDSSLRAIASHCPGLYALNISKLIKMTNIGMELLANGCRSIERLNLTRTKFSDEVIAAFLETSGESLTELTLNYVKLVGPNTAFSLARRSRNLSYLDISWCHRISTNALGLIVDSCSSLKLLKVFGCKQIDSVFLCGHSNPLVRVVGFGLMPILNHINLLEPEEVFLRYSPLPNPIDS